MLLTHGKVNFTHTSSYVASNKCKRFVTTYEQRRPTSALIIACMLLHAQHQEITDDLDLVRVAGNFVDANDKRKRYFRPPSLALD